MVDYYRNVAGAMIPHLKRYGVSMQRFPDGIQGEGFYMNVPGRLESGPDPWSGMMRHAYSLSTRRKNLDELLLKERPADEEKDGYF